MKRHLLTIAILGILAGACVTNNELDEVKARIDALQNNSIASINEQIAAIQKSVGNLSEMDNELKGFIASLQTTATELQSAVNANNEKIDKVEGLLREDLDAINKALADEITSVRSDVTDDVLAAKTELLANLVAARTEMDGQLTYVNTRIDSLKKKDAEIEAKIAELRNYTDTQISDCRNWATATFATLEQYNSLTVEVVGIKEDISAINTAIANLETRLNDKIAADIADAVSTLEGERQQAVAEITLGYKNAVAEAKGQIESAYTAAISNAIHSLESSMQAWVNGRLTGYYTISETDAKILALQQNLEGQLSAQKTYFETMIGTLSTQLESKITANTTAINTLNGEVSSLSEELAAKAQMIASNAEKIQTNAIQIGANSTAILNNSTNITTLGGSLETESAAIRALVESNKTAIEQNAALIAQQEETIKNANLSISAQDVVNNAAAIANNAALIAQNAQAIADNQSAITANATDIVALRSDMETAKTTITAAYTTAIETAINTLDGKITGKIADEVATINASMVDLEARVNAKITTLIGRVDAIEAEITSIHAQIVSIIADIAAINGTLTDVINRIQSVSFIPKYTDGMASMEHGVTSTNEDIPTMTVDLEVQPQNAVDVIIANPSMLSFKAVPAEVRTKAGSMFIGLTVKQVNKKEDGVLTVTVTGEAIDKEILESGNPIHVAAVLATSNANYTSAYFPVNMDAYYPIIRFEDPYVKAICVANWDTNGDGELSYVEASSVVSIGGEFYDNQGVRTFDELKYFTNLTELRDSAFCNNANLARLTLPFSLKYIRKSVSGKSGVLSKTAVTELEIPGSVISIAEYACQNNDLLRIVRFGSESKLEAINTGSSSASYPFKGCSHLQLFDATECKSITTIDGAFFFNGKNDASRGCVFKVGTTLPPALGSSFYYAASNSWTLYVPATAISSYAKANGWKNFETILPL